MPQTLSGWVLIAAVILAGAAGGHLSARVGTTVQDGGAINPRDVGGAAAFIAMMAIAGVLLWLVEGP